MDHKIIVEGRLHILKIRISDTIVALINVYGPNQEIDKSSFLIKLQEVLTTYDLGDHTIIEDFNIVPNNELDKVSEQNNKLDNKVETQKMLNQLLF